MFSETPHHEGIPFWAAGFNCTGEGKILELILRVVNKSRTDRSGVKFWKTVTTPSHLARGGKGEVVQRCSDERGNSPKLKGGKPQDDYIFPPDKS